MITSILKFESFIEILLTQIPELRSVYDEHINDNDELLEHVFMGDRRCVIQL